MNKTFVFKKSGKFFVAHDAADKKITYGKIDMNTGVCSGGTHCFEALIAYRESKIAKRTFTVWMEVEEVIEFKDGTEAYVEVDELIPKKAGRFASLEDAVNQIDTINTRFDGDYTQD